MYFIIFVIFYVTTEHYWLLTELTYWFKVNFWPQILGNLSLCYAKYNFPWNEIQPKQKKLQKTGILIFCEFFLVFWYWARSELVWVESSHKVTSGKTMGNQIYMRWDWATKMKFFNPWFLCRVYIPMFSICMWLGIC